VRAAEGLHFTPNGLKIIWACGQKLSEQLFPMVLLDVPVAIEILEALRMTCPERSKRHRRVNGMNHAAGGLPSVNDLLEAHRATTLSGAGKRFPRSIS
jgi:hypothetical protein